MESNAHSMKYQVFISYRREHGSNLVAVLIRTQFNAIHGIRTFLDVADLGGSYFDDRLKSIIEATPNMVMILSPGSLDRCVNKDDWVRQEISLAIKLGKRIVPLFTDNFKFPEPENLPEEIRDITRCNGVTWSHEYYDSSIAKLISFLDIRKEDMDQYAPLPRAMQAMEEVGKQVEQQKSVTSLSTDEATKDNKYLDILNMAYADGEVTPSERDILNRKANELGISSDRAKELEEQIKRERTSIHGATQILPNEISQTAVSPDESHIQGDATKEIATWPDAGITFLMNFKNRFDPTGLPFKPVAISSDEEISEDLEIDWSIDDTYYFAVFLPHKRSDKVDLRWGYYSIFEKRDPLFRKRSDAFRQNKIWLNDDEAVVIDGDIYYFNSEEGYLGFETSQRKMISSLSDPALIEVVANKMKIFSQSVWPIIVANSEK